MCDVEFDKTTQTKKTIKSAVRFDDSDPTIPYRLVGSYEYARAVQRFEKLLEISTPDEVAIYDKLLAQQPQLTFYSGMFLDPDLTERVKPSATTGLTEFKEHFLRSGLAWMLALAKMELGATISTYGDQTLKQPFGVFGPSPFDAEAFLRVMADDFYAHIKNLKQDPRFKKTVEGSRRVDSWTLAYMRRMKLLDDMVNAMESAGNRELTLRLKPESKEVEEKRSVLEMIVNSEMQTQTHQTVSTKRTSGRKKVALTDADCDDIDHNTEAGDRRSGSSQGDRKR